MRATRSPRFPTDVVDGPLPLTTTVTDATGAPIARFFEPNQNRQAVTSDQISPAMKAAIIAIEDRRFYQHNGVDWQGTIRAVIANSASGDVVQGASTLTQQYVKNYFLYVAAKTETERLKATEQTSARKLKEAQIALQMERALSKEEILTRYLNIVSFGNGAAGVAAAARTYFNTTPDKLTVAQAALLAGMVRNIAATDPVTKPQAALERRNVVIGQMRDQQMIDEGQAKAALDSPLGIANPLVTQPAGCIGAGDAGFFCKYAQSYLLDAGFTIDQLNRGGYTIKTTLDPNVLAKVKASLNQQVPPGQPNVANVMSVVQPGADKHRVLAMASNRMFGLDGGAAADQLRAALRAGQPGCGVHVQDLHRGDGPGEGPGHQLRARGAAVRLRLPDLRRRRRAADPGAERGRLRRADVAAGRAGDLAEHRVRQAGGVHRRARRGGHGGPAGHEVAGHAPRSSTRTRGGAPTVRSPQVTKDQRQASFTLGVSPDQRAGAGQRRAPRWPARAGGARPARSSRSPSRTASRCRSRRPRASRRSSPGLANTMMTGLSRDDIARHRGGGGPAGGLGPADGGQDRHHPAAQVGRVRRGGAADGGRGDHVRRLQLPPPAVRRRPGRRSPAAAATSSAARRPPRPGSGR